MNKFEFINKGYNSVFVPGHLSIGIVVPIENYQAGTIPSMKDQLKNAQLIEELGFKALWLRDIPFNLPEFGDVGQTYDPFTYLGYLAGKTNEIALGIASVVLPLHHPVNLAKAAATVDQLSDGRMIMGVASGDRPDEYPAMDIDFENRAELFRESFAYIRAAQDNFPSISTANYGSLNGNMDVLPKSVGHKLPMLVTGHSRQSLEWNAEHGDGWMYYLRNPQWQQQTITEWRDHVAQFGSHDKPFMQAMYIILHPDPDFKPQPIQLGFRTGVNFLNDFIFQLKSIGVNHLALNLRFNTMPMKDVLETIAAKVNPNFHTIKE